MSSLTTSGWRSAAAHISAVWFCDGSFAFTSAPRAISMRTASALPVPAHVMIGVSPVAIAVFGFAPALSSRSTSAAFALVHASDNGVVAKIVGRVDVRAGANQQIGGLEIVPVRGPEQRRRAVDAPAR